MSIDKMLYMVSLVQSVKYIVLCMLLYDANIYTSYMHSVHTYDEMN